MIATISAPRSPSAEALGKYPHIASLHVLATAIDVAHVALRGARDGSPDQNRPPRRERIFKRQIVSAMLHLLDALRPILSQYRIDLEREVAEERVAAELALYEDDDIPW
jgi:hypothetical protein